MAALRGYGMSTRSFETDTNVVGAPVHPELYHCPAGHVLTLNFAAEADEVPDTWDCPKCGRTAHRDETAARRASLTEGDLSVPTMSPRTMVASKTPWDMLRERRTMAELEELLRERLEFFRNR